MGSSESTKRLTVERAGEDETPGIVKVSDDLNVILRDGRPFQYIKHIVIQLTIFSFQSVLSL